MVVAESAPERELAVALRQGAAQLEPFPGQGQDGPVRGPVRLSIDFHIIIAALPVDQGGGEMIISLQGAVEKRQGQEEVEAKEDGPYEPVCSPAGDDDFFPPVLPGKPGVEKQPGQAED